MYSPLSIDCELDFNHKKLDLLSPKAYPFQCLVEFWICSLRVKSCVSTPCFSTWTQVQNNGSKFHHKLQLCVKCRSSLSASCLFHSCKTWSYTFLWWSVKCFGTQRGYVLRYFSLCWITVWTVPTLQMTAIWLTV